MLLSEFINLKEKPGCNMTQEGRGCAVHGMNECPGYKMIETSAQEKLHQRHQEIRKKSGLPNPNYYKELKATFDLSDEERQAAVAAIKKKYKVNEAGPFSYGAKKPRKGSVADLAAKKRKEQEKDKQPVEPRDHRVGVARVKQDVAEGSNRFQVGDKISFPLSQMATGIVDKIDDKRLYVKLDNGEVYTIPSTMLHSVKLLERQGVAENTTPDDEKVLELFAQIVADDTGYSVKKVNYEIYDEGLRTPSGIPVYFYSFDGDVRYIGALPGGKPTAIVNQDGEVGSRGSHLELSIGGQVEYVIKGKTLFSAADQQQIAKAKPGGDEYSLVLIALDLMWGRMQHKFMEQGAAEDQEDIVAIIDGVRSDRTYNDRYHAHNSLSKLVGYGKAKVAELYINGEKVEHFELGKKYIDFEPKSLGSMSEAGPFSYGAKKPRKGSVADLAAKKRQEQEKGKLPAEPKDHMVGVARIIK